MAYDGRRTIMQAERPSGEERLWRQLDEIEEIIELFRLELYNRGEPCGAEAIARRMRDECVKPIPSTRAIWRILSRRRLTHGRTGYYEEDN